MKLEKAERLNGALEQLVNDSEQLIAYANSMKHKINWVLNWELPEEETLESVWKSKWQITRYSCKVKSMAECIIKHY